MRNLEGSEAGTLFTGKTAVASSPLTAFAELAGAVKTELAGPVPVSVSDLPTVAVKLDPERTLPMEPVILAQLCAQTQVSERRRILPMGLEYSVHVEFAAESLPQAMAVAPPVAPTATRRRTYLLHLLVLILGPLLGLSGGAGVAWQLSRPAQRPHRPGTAPRKPSKQPAAPLSSLPLLAPPTSAPAATAPASSLPQSAPKVSAPTRVQPDRSPAAASPASSTQAATQPSSPPEPIPATPRPTSSPGNPPPGTQPSSSPVPASMSSRPASSGASTLPGTQPSSSPVPASTSSRPASSQGSTPLASLPVSAQTASGKLRSLSASATESLRPGDASDSSGVPLKRAAEEVAARRMPAPAVRAAASRLGAWYRPLASLANLASGLELDPPPPRPAPLLASLAASPALLPSSEPPVTHPSETAALPPARPMVTASRSAQQPEPDQAPRYLSGEQPRLPLLVRQMYRRETVIGTYRLCVNPSGAVAAVTPVVGIPFDEEIQRSLRSWRFAPRTTAVCIDQELHFKVDE